MSQDALEEEISFIQVMLESLDSDADDYGTKLNDLLAQREELQTRLDVITNANNQSSQNQRQGPDQNGGGSSTARPRESFWQTATNGNYGEAAALGNESSTSSRTMSAGSSFAKQNNKRPRPESSNLVREERPAKIRTPDTSYATSPHSSGDSSIDDFELIENPDAAITEKHRKRQLEIEASIARNRQAVQADAELARRLSQQNGNGCSPPSTSSNAYNSRNNVQTTIGHGGIFAKPPPSQIKNEYPGSMPESSSAPFMRNSLGSNPWNPDFSAHNGHVKHEPGPSQPSQRLPQRSHNYGLVDLTASDGEDDHSQQVAWPMPPTQRTVYNQPNTSFRSTMPGSYPMYGTSTPRQYGSNGHPPPPQQGYDRARFDASLRAARSAGGMVYNHGLSQVQQLEGLLGRGLGARSTAYGGAISDDDDDEIVYSGSRKLNPYAGLEDLYNSRYREIASYDPAKTKEEINALLESIRPDEDMPANAMVKTPEAMNIRLHKYQEMGLTWLTKCEEGNNKGGILGDEMGLGKTIQLLSLMVTRKSDDPRCKTTLIVAPVALLRQWKQEIQHKIKPGRHTLSVYTHHGQTKKKDFNEFRHYDVVLTTYGSLASEIKKEEKFAVRKNSDPQAQRRPDEKCVIIGNDKLWYRVLLDEAQCIKNKGTQTSKGACSIHAKYRFCMTGTPMMNNVEELFSLIKFLKIKPYSTWENFRRDFTQPLKSGHDETKDRAMQKLQALCKAIMLRRTKKSTYEGKPILVLPERTTDTDNVEFSQDESDFYKALENKSQLQFNKYLRKGTVGNNYSAVLVLLLRLRQACCHPHLIRDFGVSASADITPDAMVELARQFEYHVITRIKETEGNFECPVCYDAQTNPAIFFPCGHDTCQECFSKIADPATALAQGNEGGGAKCPECRGPIDPKKVTDFASFKKVHMPELLSQEEREGMQEDEEEDSDSDSDSDSEDDDETPSEDGDDADEKGNLDGFIVDDNADVEEDVKPKKKKPSMFDRPRSPTRRLKIVDDNSDATQAEDDGPAAGPSGGIKVVKTEPGVKEEWDSDDQQPEVPDIFKQFAKKSTGNGKGKAKAKDEDDQDFQPADSSAKPKKTEKSKKARGKEKKKDKKEKSSITLAQLKKDSTKNIAARKRYIKRLRKDYVSSAKIEKTMEILTEIMNRPQDPAHAEPERILIFSQWTSLLDLVEVPIDNAGWGYRRYDGSLSARMRGDAVDDFNDPRQNVRIMLVSLKAGNAGLNLNKASQVIILDPFWNPYTEEQAIDRAHRIGQEREVKVHRVLVPETVEDRIIALQEKKRELISTALDEKAAASISRLGVRELAYLFGVTGNSEQNVEYQAQPPRQRAR